MFSNQGQANDLFRRFCAHQPINQSSAGLALCLWVLLGESEERASPKRARSGLSQPQPPEEKQHAGDALNPSPGRRGPGAARRDAGLTLNARLQVSVTRGRRLSWARVCRGRVLSSDCQRRCPLLLCPWAQEPGSRQANERHRSEKRRGRVSKNGTW